MANAKKPGSKDGAKASEDTPAKDVKSPADPAPEGKKAAKPQEAKPAPWDKTASGPESAAKSDPTKTIKAAEASKDAKPAGKTADTAAEKKDLPKEAEKLAVSAAKPAASTSADKVLADKSTSDKAKSDKAKLEQAKSDKVKSEKAKSDKATLAKGPSDKPAPTSAKTASEAPAAKAPPPPPQRSVFWPVVLGGVVAAALGFVASEANLLGFRTMNDDLRAMLTEQQQRITALEAVEAPQVDLSGIEGQLTGLSETLAALDTRVTALQERPVVIADGATGDAAALAQMQDALAQQQGEIQELIANAQSIEEATAAAAMRAAGQAAISKIAAALGTGASYADQVAVMEQAGIDDLPEALTAPAAEGVVTLTNLQARFPDTARAALSAARAVDTGEGETGVGGFLRRQLGARSVAPREGSDPDAVLSRAEAAVRDGQLAQALSETDALPDDAKAAMDDWLSDARTRAAAEAAMQDLTERLTAN